MNRADIHSQAGKIATTEWAKKTFERYWDELRDIADQHTGSELEPEDLDALTDEIARVIHNSQLG